MAPNNSKPSTSLQFWKKKKRRKKDGKSLQVIPVWWKVKKTCKLFISTEHCCTEGRILFLCHFTYTCICNVYVYIYTYTYISIPFSFFFFFLEKLLPAIEHVWCIQLSLMKPPCKPSKTPAVYHGVCLQCALCTQNSCRPCLTSFPPIAVLLPTNISKKFRRIWLPTYC